MDTPTLASLFAEHLPNDPLASAKHLIEASESKRRRELDKLSAKSLTYGVLLDAVKLAELYSGNDFPGNSAAETTHLLTLQAVILQRLAEITALESDPRPVPPRTGKPWPTAEAAEVAPGAPEKSAFEHTIETVLTRRIDELEKVVERLHRNVVGTQAELDETRKRLERRWTTCEAEANHLDGACSQIRDLETRCHEIESRQTSEEDLHRGAVTLGGFDGRLCRIERKLERLAEVIASK